MSAEVVKMYCQTCGEEIPSPASFKDELSLREFFISGMCQTCQDKFFGPPK